MAETSTIDVLFFSRGRGWGHALPDIAVYEEMRRLKPDIQVRFASYAAGADVIRDRVGEVIDLGLPERNSALETLVAAADKIAELRPRLVVAHEEFGAVPAARVHRVPCLFLTDWFVEEQRFAMSALEYAERILFFDDPGYYPEPPGLAGKIDYLGPFVRRLKYGAADREKARLELGFTAEELVIAVSPGGRCTEAVAPLAAKVGKAFVRLETQQKKLLWLAGNDGEAVRQALPESTDIHVLDREWEPERFFVAADAVITRGTRKTAFELAELGRPNLAISIGDNPIDEFRVPRIPGVSWLTNEASAEDIVEALGKPAVRPTGGRQTPPQVADALATSAVEIVRWVDRS